MDATLWLLLLAPFIGSFLGVVVHRLPRGQPVALARSSCEGCGRRLRPRDMLPLLSFAWLRGRCRCRAMRIAPYHLLVELAALAVAGWAVLAQPDPLRQWLDCGLGWTLLALCWIDARHRRLPDALTLPLLLGGLLATWLGEPERLPAHALGAALGYAAFRLIALAYRALRGRDGLGQGDAKLLAAGGAWLGWEPLNTLVLLAALLGILLALWLGRRQGRVAAAGTVIPFGPCLGLAIWLLRLHGSALSAWSGLG